MKLRVGKISINLFKDTQESITEYSEMFSLLKFIPLRAECVYFGRKIEAEGISPLFDECPQGTVTPSYEIIVHTVEGKVDSIEAKKIEG